MRTLNFKSSITSHEACGQSKIMTGPRGIEMTTYDTGMCFKKEALYITACCNFCNICFMQEHLWMNKETYR